MFSRFDVSVNYSCGMRAHESVNSLNGNIENCEDIFQLAKSLFNTAINMGGEVNQTSLAGQPPTLTVSTSGGLLGGDFKGRYLTLKPWQVSFVDQMVWTEGNHVVTFGGEVRLLHTSLDQLFWDN